MPLSLKLLPVKRNYLFGSVTLLLISLTCLAFSMTDSDNYEIGRREVLLREIGHEVLLQSGDRTSRVLPVKKVAKNEYQISFENELSFVPDSLVNTTRQILNKDAAAHNYIVKVLQPGSDAVVYGFAISSRQKGDIIACKGRKQPTAHYLINIQFKPKGVVHAKNGYLLGGLSILVAIGFIFFIPANRRKGSHGDQPEEQVTGETDHNNIDVFTLGSFLFDPKSQALLQNGNRIDLTGTETRVLRMFALFPNEMIERSRLQKEIWEDEGVIVGRSLDMFISKLRKKLEVDPAVKIVVIRGKGYRLEINTEK